MKYKRKGFLAVLVAILLVTPFAMAADLTITSYTDPATQDYQADDTLQLGLAENGIVAEHFQTSPLGMDPGPLTFGTTTANAVGYGNFGTTLGTHDYWTTGIVYTLNTTSPWWNNNTLKDITIYVYPSDTARRHYDFEVQYMLNDGTGVYYDVFTELPVDPEDPSTRTRIQDLSVPVDTGTKIEITNIDVSNVSRVWIWATPIVDGFYKYSTTISEIDVNFDSCSSYPKQDINTDCSIDIDDLALFVKDWLEEWPR